MQAENQDFQGIFGKVYRCNDIIKEKEDIGVLSLLSYVLFEMPDSPFLRDFLNQGYAEKYCPGYGYDLSTRFSTFTLGFGNVSNDIKQMRLLEREIEKVLENLKKEGISKSLSEVAINHLELEARKPK